MSSPPAPANRTILPTQMKAQMQKEITVPPVWARRPGEGGEAFEAFMIYRELGPKRTSGEVARIVMKQPALIRRWMGKWEWQMRVAVWDEKVQQKKDEAVLNEVAEMGKRQARLGMQIQELARLRLDTMQPAELTVQDTIRMAKDGAELERTARGEDKGQAGGNIIFNFNMKSPPSWTPAGIMKQVAPVLPLLEGEGEIKDENENGGGNGS